jgi:hypothetical protein
MENLSGTDVDRVKLIRPPELSGNPTTRVIWQQAGVMDKGNEEFGFAKYFFLYLKVIYHML